MLIPAQKSRRRPWLSWLRFSIVLFGVIGAGFVALKIGQRYLGVQKLVIEYVSITGCQWDRLSEVQQIADETAMGRPLFFFDVGELQTRIESLRWVKAVLIRREPPDRLSIVIEERQPLIMLVRPNAILLMSDDGIIMERINQANLTPIPVVADSASQDEGNLVQLMQAARVLKSQQPDFYSRLTELRWSDSGPTVFMEGLSAPIYISKNEPAKNIPSFQALFLQLYANKPDLSDVRYFDLRWDNQISVGELPEHAMPQVQTQ